MHGNHHTSHIFLIFPDHGGGLCGCFGGWFRFVAAVFHLFRNGVRSRCQLFNGGCLCLSAISQCLGCGCELRCADGNVFRAFVNAGHNLIHRLGNMKQCIFYFLKFTFIIVMESYTELSFRKLSQYFCRFINVFDIFFQTCDRFFKRCAKLSDFVFAHNVKFHIQISVSKLLCGLIQIQNRFCKACGAFADSECNKYDAGGKQYDQCDYHKKQYGIKFG